MKIKIYIITLLLSAVLGSCSSSFLDEKTIRTEVLETQKESGLFRLKLTPPVEVVL